MKIQLIKSIYPLLIIISCFNAFAQNRNQQMRAFNEVVSFMNEFSYCSYIWVNDASVLQSGIQESKERINPNYFYNSKTQGGLIHHTGIEEAFRFPEITPNGENFVPRYQSDFIKWLKARDTIRKLIHQTPSLLAPIHAELKHYMQAVDSLFASHLVLLDYVYEKNYLSDSQFQKGKQLLIDQDRLFKLVHQTSLELFQRMESFANENLKPNHTHPELQQGLVELRKSVDLLKNWEKEVYEGKSSNDLPFDQQLRKLQSASLSLDSTYFYHTRGYNNKSSGWWIQPRYRYFFTSMESTIFWYAKTRIIPERSKSYRQIRVNKFASSYNLLINEYNRYIAIADGLTYSKDAACCLSFNEIDTSQNVLLNEWRLHFIFEYIPEKEITLAKDTLSNNTAISSHAQQIQQSNPHHLIYVLDVSSSMNEGEKLKKLKESATYLIGIQRAVDYMTLLTFAGKSEVIVSRQSCDQKEQLSQKLEQLKATGQTNFQSGMDQAKNQVDEGKTLEIQQSVIIFSDGEFSVTSHTQQQLQAMTQANAHLNFVYLGPKLKKKQRLSNQRQYASWGITYFDVNELSLNDILVQIATTD